MLKREMKEAEGDRLTRQQVVEKISRHISTKHRAKVVFINNPLPLIPNHPETCNRILAGLKMLPHNNRVVTSFPKQNKTKLGNELQQNHLGTEFLP